MPYEFSRTQRILGEEAMSRLRKSRIAVFGIGGVGSFVVEALVRSGVGHFVLVDDDRICLSNLNRQIHATHETLGRPKVEVMRERILSINPEAEVETHQRFYLPGMAGELLSADYDYIVDAVDTVAAKLDLIVNAKEMKIPIISCMGTGNKMDPTRLEVADIYQTSVCPLAKVVRKELRTRGVESLKVVYSREEPIKPIEFQDAEQDADCDPSNESDPTPLGKRQIPGSVSFVPSVAGLIIASEVVKDIIHYRSPHWRTEL